MNEEFKEKICQKCQRTIREELDWCSEHQICERCCDPIGYSLIRKYG